MSKDLGRVVAERIECGDKEAMRDVINVVVMCMRY